MGQANNTHTTVPYPKYGLNMMINRQIHGHLSFEMKPGANTCQSLIVVNEVTMTCNLGDPTL